MLTNSRLAYHSHDHKRCVNAALQRAQVLCNDNQARLTPIREAVLRTIWASHRPLGAYDIVDKMTLNGNSGKKYRLQRYTALSNSYLSKVLFIALPH